MGRKGMKTDNFWNPPSRRRPKFYSANWDLEVQASPRWVSQDTLACSLLASLRADKSLNKVPLIQRPKRGNSTTLAEAPFLANCRWTRLREHDMDTRLTDRIGGGL